MNRCAITSDIHSCFPEFVTLLKTLGYILSEGDIIKSNLAPPLFFLGDLTDRGEYPVETIALLGLLIDKGYLTWAAIGNHDERLYNALNYGIMPPRLGGLPETLLLLSRHPLGFAATQAFLDLAKDIPRASVLMPDLWVTHGSLRPNDLSWCGIPHHEVPADIGLRITSGETHGEFDEMGRPIRTFEWAPIWQDAVCVFGHNTTPSMLPGQLVNSKVFNTDTGSVFGGHLSAVILDEGKAPSSIAIKSGHARAQNPAKIRTWPVKDIECQQHEVDDSDLQSWAAVAYQWLLDHHKLDAPVTFPKPDSWIKYRFSIPNHNTSTDMWL